MSRPVPTDYERQMAGVVAEAAAGDPTAIPALVAEALANHRARTVHLALAMVPRSATPSEHALELMRDGWTPRQVLELIDAHRALLIQLRRMRELLPATLGAGPGAAAEGSNGGRT
ncbi:MAG TPA: hypothetical protein VD838_02980 [Anaeromyxobacteraceae bacterium]|nr:hypothetical protein [Anaeromyxobacteraceae bacterium]